MFRFLPLFLFALLMSCTTGSDDDSLSPNERLVVGTWAGNLNIDDASGLSLLATYTYVINEDKSYSVSLRMQVKSEGVDWNAYKESGTWIIKNNALETTPRTCQDSDGPDESLKLIVCEEADSPINLNISNDTWVFNRDLDGEIVTLTMKKL